MISLLFYQLGFRSHSLVEHTLFFKARDLYDLFYFQTRMPAQLCNLCNGTEKKNKDGQAEELVKCSACSSLGKLVSDGCLRRYL